MIKEEKPPQDQAYARSEGSGEGPTSSQASTSIAKRLWHRLTRNEVQFTPLSEITPAPLNEHEIQLSVEIKGMLTKVLDETTKIKDTVTGIQEQQSQILDLSKQVLKEFKRSRK